MVIRSFWSLALSNDALKNLPDGRQALHGSAFRNTVNMDVKDVHEDAEAGAGAPMKPSSEGGAARVRPAAEPRLQG